jgi:hypothetical protein
MSALVGLLGVPGTAAAAAADDDARLARQATLALADFPSDGEWDGKALESADAATQQQQDESLQPYRECAGLRAAYQQLYSVPNAASTYTTADQSQSASDYVALFVGPKAAQRYLAEYQSKNVGSCLRRYFEGTADPSNQAHATVRPLPRAIQRAGGGTFGTRLAMAYTSNGQPGTQFLDFVSVRRGRAVASFSFSALGRPLADDLERGLIEAVAGRLPKG